MEVTQHRASPPEPDSTWGRDGGGGGGEGLIPLPGYLVRADPSAFWNDREYSLKGYLVLSLLWFLTQLKNPSANPVL